MKGTLRFFLGLLITLGAVGTLDHDPNADLLTVFITGAVGLFIMYSGALALGNAK